MTTVQSISDIDKYNEEMSAVFYGLKNNTIDVKHAEAMTNAAGKLIKGQIEQIHYYEQRNEIPNIPFWKGKSSGTPKGKPLK